MKEGLAARWRQQDEFRRRPKARLAAIGAAADRCCTAYLSAFRFIESRLATGAVQSDTTLVVYGDLFEGPAPKPFEPPAVEDGEGDAFQGIRIILVRPFAGRGGHSRSEIDGF
jgi:hypothetical protein